MNLETRDIWVPRDTPAPPTTRYPSPVRAALAAVLARRFTAAWSHRRRGGWADQRRRADWARSPGQGIAVIERDGSMHERGSRVVPLLKHSEMRQWLEIVL